MQLATVLSKDGSMVLDEGPRTVLHFLKRHLQDKGITEGDNVWFDIDIRSPLPIYDQIKEGGDRGDP